jgi:hypothetical protein
LKTIFGFIGVTDVKIVTAGGVAQVMTGTVRKVARSKKQILRASKWQISPTKSRSSLERRAALAGQRP